MNPFLYIFKFFSKNKEKIFSKDSFFAIIIVGLVIYILFMQGCGGRGKDKQIEILQKQILKLDKTVQESNGSYHKLVDNFATEKDLRNEVESFNKELAKQIKKNDEKLLMVSNAVLSFDKKLDKGITVNVTRDSATGEKIISFVTRYPTDNPNDEWFVKYDGKIYTESEKLDGEWEFNKLKFNVVLTEQQNGMWATRIDGPDFLHADSIKVNALPKDKIAGSGDDKLSLLVGAGYRTLVNLKSTGNLTLSGGFGYKKNMVLVDVSSNQMIGLTFIRKLRK